MSPGPPALRPAAGAVHGAVVRYFVHPNDLHREPWDVDDWEDRPIEVITTMVHVLVPTAVYDHGVIGVYATPEDARVAAQKIWPQTDGHHKLVIHAREIGATHDDVFIRKTASDRHPGVPRIEGP